MDDAVSAIEKMVQYKKKSYVVAVNVDVIIKIENDSLLKKISDEAAITLVDGKPLVWISKLHNKPIAEKISGSDLVPRILDMASKKGHTVFLLGGREGVAERAKANIEKDYPGIRIVGAYAPPFSFDKSEQELEKTNAIISDAKPDILIVCFGCPKQEKWIYANRDKYDATVSICAGATIDFLAGNVKRAPKWMSDNGLEWFYRFIKEPTRMFKRYFVDDTKILRLILKYK
jgi:N-acetylglucosaminyldiphosphoundecaprenol N-acetyl-beta-D-mannosaminyltransferase